MEPVLSSTTKRRGHQHHPRHTTRRRLNQNLLNTPSSLLASQSSQSGSAQCDPDLVVNDVMLIKDLEGSKSQLNLRLNFDSSSLRQIPEVLRDMKKHSDESKCSHDDRVIVIQNETPEKCDHNVSLENIVKMKVCKNSFFDDENLKNNTEPHYIDPKVRNDNLDKEIVTIEEDPEITELSKLRCTSERIEIQAEREARRRKYCADYPGLAFGHSIFSSDTMMKFRLIRNELQNIMSTQLKRMVAIIG